MVWTLDLLSTKQCHTALCEAVLYFLLLFLRKSLFSRSRSSQFTVLALCFIVKIGIQVLKLICYVFILLIHCIMLLNFILF